jgi:hypothetical protein
MYWSLVLILIENKHESWNSENEKPLWIQIEKQQAIENILSTNEFF